MDKILCAIKDDLYCIKMVGRIRYPLSPGFDEFIKRIFSKGTCEDIVIDLNDAEMIDSTNLGLLARITNLLTAKNGKKATIISQNNDINVVLSSMGFDSFFTIITDSQSPASDFKSLPSVEKNAKQKAEIILAAHRELMDLNEKNRIIFKDVVTILESDLHGST